MTNYNVLGVILARGGSKGIPKKNIYKIAGHPLISYSIEAAKKSKFISQVVVSTDDHSIARIARKYGAVTPFIRSKKLSGDKVASVDALYDCVEKTEKILGKKFDFIIELPCVSPLRDHTDIDSALNILFTKKYDSVISYTNTGEKHPVRLKRIKQNKVTNFCKDYSEPDKGSRRQDFEPCYIRNGAIYSMSRDCIINQKSRNGKKSFPFIMSNEKSINIDEKFDLIIAELLIEGGYCKNNPRIIKKEKKTKFIKDNLKKKTILVTTPTFFLKEKINLLKRFFNCIIISKPSKKELIEQIKKVDAWLCHPSPEYYIDEKILKYSNSIKLIATPSTGTNHIDENYCEKNNIKILPITVSKKFNDIKASSEFTFLLCILGFKRILDALKMVKKGNWRNIEDEIRGNEIFGKNIGIIGYGRIGKNLDKYFTSMNANVNFYDNNNSIRSKKKKSLNSILKNSDLIILSSSYSKKNYNYADKNFFKKMKNNSIFVNTSRGEMVDEFALLSALRKKKLKCAILDVVKNEQYLNTKSNMLIEYAKKNKNLIITPHMAGLTYESEKKAFLISVENIINFFK